MTSQEIRESFLKFFENKGHCIVPSSSLLPESPNLLFTNAGMNPFVPYFLGERKPTLTRIVDTQKCIRAGGKHNDLDEVGFDTYHHTFFEMLGNWSFGDFFKKEAIQWAWELLTQVWKMPKERLYATVYKPDVGEPAAFDADAYTIWKEIFQKEGLDPDIHIVFGNKKDNFWMMGDTGPCGPCSEIHIDLTLNGDSKGTLVNQGDVRCIEIWNLVFIQYNALMDGSFELLQNKFVDTGMGLERVAGIFATTHNFTDFSKIPSNYDSDLFSSIFDWLKEHSGHTYKGCIASIENVENDTNVLKDCAFRIIADHVRTLTFAIADGILPGNEGRNYVLRRIVRRAILFGQKLGLSEGFFSELSKVVVEQMGAYFQELKHHADIIKQVLLKEERNFQLTLARGLHLFERWALEDPKILSGEKAFKLYDTYGFPIDLTELIAKERGIKVDNVGFEAAMKQQKERSKAAAQKSVVLLAKENKIKTKFIGYDRKNLCNRSAQIIDVVDASGKTCVIVDTTPFYGEKGGQIGDTGAIIFENDCNYPVINTLWDGDMLLHVLEGAKFEEIQKFIGTQALLTVDYERRLQIERHHSATHLLHWALRKVLGDHVHQAGSLVTNQSLRFDFSHFEKLTEEQLQKIERLCNEKILENVETITEEIDYEKRPAGCLAFFEDKYGDRVRVVKMGPFSIELCGGTHVHCLGELGQLRITQETSIAAGLRRIEAVVGMVAYEMNVQQSQQIKNLEKQMECPLTFIFDKYQNLYKQKQDLEIKHRQILQKNVEHVIEQVAEVQNLHCVLFQIQTIDTNLLRSLCKNYFSNNHVDILLAASEFDNKGIVLLFCSNRAIQSGYFSGNLVQKFLKPLGANGGGKPDFASGGIKDVMQLRAAWKQFNWSTFLS